LKPIDRRFRQAALDDARERRDGLQRRWIAVEHSPHDFACGFTLERATTGQQLVQHGAEAEDVGALVGRPAVRLLG
jgi:hypothetical protein